MLWLPEMPLEVRLVSQSLGQLESEVFVRRGWGECSRPGDTFEDIHGPKSGKMPCWPWGIPTSRLRIVSRNPL
jgi:hypothetical protein